MPPRRKHAAPPSSPGGRPSTTSSRVGLASRKAPRHPFVSSGSAEDEQHVSVNYSRQSRENLHEVRCKNQNVLCRDSPDDRFRTVVQMDLYNSLYKDANFLCYYIDWRYVQTQRCFDGIQKKFSQVGIEELVSDPFNWNAEAIRQFYATVFICPETQKITWMTDGSVYTASKKQFADAIGVPSHDDLPKFIRSDHDDGECINKTEFYDSSEYKLGKTAGLSALAYGINNIIRKTILPRAGAKTDIYKNAWFVLDNLCKGTKFDVADLLIREIESHIFDPKRKRIYYAAYIMKLICKVCKYNGRRDFVHPLYRPDGDNKKNKWNRLRQYGENGQPPQQRAERQPEHSQFQLQVLAMLTAQSCMLDEQKMIWPGMKWTLRTIEDRLCRLQTGQECLDQLLKQLSSSAASFYRHGYARKRQRESTAQPLLSLDRAVTCNEEHEENGELPQPQGQTHCDQFQEQVIDMLTSNARILDAQKVFGTIEERLSSLETRQVHMQVLLREFIASAGVFHGRALAPTACGHSQSSSPGS